MGACSREDDSGECLVVGVLAHGEVVDAGAGGSFPGGEGDDLGGDAVVAVGVALAGEGDLDPVGAAGGGGDGGGGGSAGVAGAGGLGGAGAGAGADPGLEPDLGVDHGGRGGDGEADAAVVAGEPDRGGVDGQVGALGRAPGAGEPGGDEVALVVRGRTRRLELLRPAEGVEVLEGVPYQGLLVAQLASWVEVQVPALTSGGSWVVTVGRRGRGVA